MNQEQYNLAKTAKSAEELVELAKKNGLDITLEEATGYFKALNDSKSKLSDEELESVSGGCGGDDKKQVKKEPVRFNKMYLISERRLYNNIDNDKKCFWCDGYIWEGEYYYQFIYGDDDWPGETLEHLTHAWCRYKEYDAQERYLVR